MTTAAVSSLTIRRAEPRDAALLAALFCDAAMLPFTLIPPYSSAAHWDKRLGEYADAACLPLVAFAGEALVGVLLLRAFPNHVRRKHAGVLDLLAVRPDHRRHGVGRALLNAAIRAADEGLQLRRIEVNVPRRVDYVDPAPTPLERFYASFGFEPEGVKRCELAHADGYADSATMARINATTMPAPPSPALPAAKRPRRSAPVKVVIRPATEDDAEGFAQVFADRSAALGTLQHPYTTAELWRTRLTASGPGNRQAMFVALVNGRMVGNAGVHPVSDNPRLRHVCGIGISIMTRYQGLGIGRMLMNMTLDFAERWANYSRIELTVHADNARAIKLYESLGFLHEGRHRDFSFREGGYVDALFMARCTSELSATRT